MIMVNVCCQCHIVKKEDYNTPVAELCHMKWCCLSQYGVKWPWIREYVSHCLTTIVWAVNFIFPDHFCHSTHSNHVFVLIAIKSISTKTIWFCSMIEYTKFLYHAATLNLIHIWYPMIKYIAYICCNAFNLFTVHWQFVSCGGDGDTYNFTWACMIMHHDQQNFYISYTINNPLWW